MSDALDEDTFYEFNIHVTFRAKPSQGVVIFECINSDLAAFMGPNNYIASYDTMANNEVPLRLKDHLNNKFGKSPK